MKNVHRETCRPDIGQRTDTFMEALSVSWVDFVVVAVLGFGLWRGRKRGMSEEFLDIVKWVVTVLAAGFLYQPVGQLLSQSTSVLSTLACYVGTYLTLVLVIAIVFSYIKRGAGEKITGSDAFGSGEYYLGMISGTLRYGCILLVTFAFLNARAYSPEEIKASERYQLDNFGSSFFMTLPDLQREVFAQSMAGRCVRDYLGFVLIQPTPAGGKQLGGAENIAHARERSVYDVLDKK